MSTSKALLGSFEDWDGFYSYMSVWGGHILVGVCLSAVTIFRREMSCNRVFHQEEEIPESCETSTFSDELEAETEELLDGAGMFCSGQPILSLASVWLDCFPGEGQEGEPSIQSKWLQEDMTPSDLLDRAGNYCSGEPLLAAMASFLFQKTKSTIPFKVAEHQYDPFTHELPPDVHVHITSFLHPKDVVALSCVSKTYREVVDHSDTSSAIWNTLWRRDYVWIVKEWSFGQEALRRSNPQNFVVEKDFYFAFGQCYLNYVLAGQNTADRCLVGLHSDIYDITGFLDAHPGSPDTLMVHSGKQATRFFEDMGHSMGARRLAKKLCVVTDLSHTGEGWGLRPTRNTVLVNANKVPPRVLSAGNNLPLGRKQRRRGGTLQRIGSKLELDLQNTERRIAKRYSYDDNVLGSVNPYYDPFLQEWRIWYTDANLETVFAPA